VYVFMIGMACVCTTMGVCVYMYMFVCVCVQINVSAHVCTYIHVYGSTVESINHLTVMSMCAI
jgi:hypothetical protein